MPDTPDSWPKLSRSELIELVRRIIEGNGTEEEIESWAHAFDAAVLMPGASSMIFWPNKYDARKDQPPIASYDPSPEEVVDTVLAYRPISLGGGS